MKTYAQLVAKSFFLKKIKPAVQEERIASVDNWFIVLFGHLE